MRGQTTLFTRKNKRFNCNQKGFLTLDAIGEPYCLQQITFLVYERFKKVSMIPETRELFLISNKPNSKFKNLLSSKIPNSRIWSTKFIHTIRKMKYFQLYLEKSWCFFHINLYDVISLEMYDFWEKASMMSLLNLTISGA